MTAIAPAITRPSRDRVVVIGAVAVMVCLWASAFVAIRFADRELSSGALALGRLLVGSAALGVLVLVRRAPFPN
ncbi:MAG: EamA family transporter, partial [Solirubrobacteraceae bacterium]